MVIVSVRNLNNVFCGGSVNNEMKYLGKYLKV